MISGMVYVIDSPIILSLVSTQFKHPSKYGHAILHLLYELVKEYLNPPVCACMNKRQRGYL